MPAHCPIPTVKAFVQANALAPSKGTWFHDVVTGPAQLVRHRFERQHPVALGLLSVIEALDPRTVTDGKVGRFDKRPSQILVSVLGIAPS